MTQLLSFYTSYHSGSTAQRLGARRYPAGVLSVREQERVHARFHSREGRHRRDSPLQITLCSAGSGLKFSKKLVFKSKISRNSPIGMEARSGSRLLWKGSCFPGSSRSPTIISSREPGILRRNYQFFLLNTGAL